MDCLRHRFHQALHRTKPSRRSIHRTLPLCRLRLAINQRFQMRLHAANATDLRAFAAMFVATLSAISMLLLVSLALVVPHALLHRPRKRFTASTTPSSTTAEKPSRFSTTFASSNNKYSPMRHNHRLLHQHRHLHGHPLYYDLLNCWTRQPHRHHRRRQHPATALGT